MDPSKRICLKNLPEGCTKREIAELIRNRIGTPIHSIDLGLGPDGETRRYAHFSCEGAKHVLEVLGTGVTLRDSVVSAHPAKMHYSFRYAEARRKREREEAEAKEQLEAYWTASKQRFLDRTNGGELPKGKPPKDFYASKQKYARIAAEIAQTCRTQSGAAAHTHTARYACGAAHTAAAYSHGKEGEGGATYAGGHAAENSGASADPTAVDAVTASAASGAPLPASRAHLSHAHTGKKRAPRSAAAAKTKAPAAPPPPPPPPEPSKEERKLSGLQAKLAALKEKLKK